MTKCSIVLKSLWTIVGIVNRKLEATIWNFKLEGEKMAKKIIHICEVCGKTDNRNVNAEEILLWEQMIRIS